MFSSISIAEFLKLDSVNLIDVRSVEKFNSKHIDGAINIPSSKLLLDPSAFLDKGIRYYIYCQHGMTSLNVCKILSRLGYDVVNISGGYEAWILFNR